MTQNKFSVGDRVRVYSNTDAVQFTGMASNPIKIPGYRGYFADKFGNIWSSNSLNKKLRVLSASDNGHGYLKVRPKRNGQHKTISVHILVTRAFHGLPPNENMEVCHKDGDRKNNVPSNLRWGTAKENALDRRKHGNDTWMKNLRQYQRIR